MSNIVFTSDIHILGPRFDATAFDDFMVKAQLRNPEAFVIGGDLSHGKNSFKKALKLIKDKYFPDTPVLVVSGNHDIWSTNWRKTSTTDEAFYTEIPRICEECKCIYLEQENFKLNNWLLTGSIIWYDYSAKREHEGVIKLLPDAYYAANIKDGTKDSDYVKLSKSNIDFANERVEALVERIQDGLMDKDSEHVAVFTHMPILPETITWKDHGWNLGTPYFYNLTAGDTLTKMREVRLIVSGHTHFGKENMMRGFPCLVCYADYGKPSGFNLELIEDGTVTYEVI